MRCNWVPAETKDVVAKINKAYERHYGQGSRKLTRDEYSQPIGIKKGFGFSDMSYYGFTDVVCKMYDTTIIYTADEYIGILETFPDHRALPESNRAALYAELSSFYKRFGFFEMLCGQKQMYEVE
jgi:hypothetical protein